MLPEMYYIDSELLPMLREQQAKHKRSAKKQLAQLQKTKNTCSLILNVNGFKEAEKLPDYNLEEIHYDSEKMFVYGLKAALSAALADGDAVPSVRANMGCGIFAALTGLKQDIFPDKMPWLQAHLSRQEIMALSPDGLIETPEYKAGLQHMRYMKEKLTGTGIEVYPMDLQGPVDTAHLIYGDSFFYDLYDDEELISHLFELANACIIKGARDCLDIIAPDEYVAHYNGLVLPADAPLKISEDTSTLLGREHILELAVPNTNKIFSEFGGGYIHYCGKNEHLYKAAVDLMPQSMALNFGNPEKHDMNAVIDEIKTKGIFYYGAFSQDELFDTVKKSYYNGVYHVIPVVYCELSQQDRIIEAFNKAVDA